MFHTQVDPACGPLLDTMLHWQPFTCIRGRWWSLCMTPVTKSTVIQPSPDLLTAFLLRGGFCLVRQRKCFISAISDFRIQPCPSVQQAMPERKCNLVDVPAVGALDFNGTCPAFDTVTKPFPAFLTKNGDLPPLCGPVRPRSVFFRSFQCSFLLLCLNPHVSVCTDLRNNLP